MNQEPKSLDHTVDEESESRTEAPRVKTPAETDVPSLDDSELRVLVETMKKGLLVTDVDDRILCANRRVCELLGYTAEEMLGHYGREFISSADQHFYKKQLAHRSVGGKHRYEINWITQDAANVLTLISPAPRYDEHSDFVGSFAVLTDLSGVRHIEQELIRERILLGALMNHLPDGVYVKNTEGRYVTANDAHCDFIAVNNIHDAIGKRTREFFVESAYPPHYEEDQEVIQTGKPAIGHQHRILDRQGQERWVQISKVPLTDSNGTVTGLVGVERDVTESKHTEEAVRAAARMEATSTLAGGISHNFNNLMTIVLANAELLEMNLPADAKTAACYSPSLMRPPPPPYSQDNSSSSPEEENINPPILSSTKSSKTFSCSSNIPFPVPFNSKVISKTSYGLPVPTPCN